MKNLKRGMSFILALAMLLGCFSSGMVAWADDDGDVEPVLPESVSISNVSFDNNTDTTKADVTVTLTGDVIGDEEVYAIFATAQPSATTSATTLTYTAGSAIFIKTIDYPTAVGTYKLYATMDSGTSWTPSVDKTYEVEAVTPAFNHNINYDPLEAKVTAEAVKDKVYTEDTNTYKNASDEVYLASIDLVTEVLTIPEGFTVAAYSIDGGSKWKTGTPGADMSKLLKKDLELVLTNKYDAKNKTATQGVAASGDTSAVGGATVITFPKIAGRPKVDKLVVNYLRLADREQWILANKDGSAATEGIAKLQIAVADSTKKKPDENGWGNFGSASDGINIKPLLSTGKVDKTIYLVRSAPVGGNDGNAQAASAFYKVTASGQLAAPKLKADYKNEVIKVKAGIALGVGDGSFVEYAKAAAGSVAEVPKAGASISATLSDEETYAYAYTVATAKKPASAEQIIKLAPRTAIEAKDLKSSISSGKLKLDTKTYEVFDTTKTKWGGLPKTTASAIYDVRVKATAKADKNGSGYTGKAASEKEKLSITWGVWDAAKNKLGITAAVIGTPETPKEPVAIALAVKEGATATSSVDKGNINVVVSGAVTYENNTFTGVEVTDFAGELDITGTTGKPKADIFGGQFTVLGITNMLELLADNGVTDSVYIVQTNPALEIYKNDNNITPVGASYQKAKTYDISADGANLADVEIFNILLFDKNKVTAAADNKAVLAIYEDDSAVAPVFTITVDASGLIVGKKLIAEPQALNLDVEDIKAFYHTSSPAGMPVADCSAELEDGVLSVNFPVAMMTSGASGSPGLGAVALNLRNGILGSDLATSTFALEIEDHTTAAMNGKLEVYYTTNSTDWSEVGKTDGTGKPAGGFMAAIMPSGYQVGFADDGNADDDDTVDIAGWLVIYLDYNEPEFTLLITGADGKEYYVEIVTATQQAEATITLAVAEAKSAKAIAVPVAVSNIKDESSISEKVEEYGVNLYSVTGNQIDTLRSDDGVVAINYTLDPQYKDGAYSNTRINVTVDSDDVSDPDSKAYLLAYSDKTYELINTGFMGVWDGQPVQAFNTVSTLTFFATEAGKYSITIELVTVEKDEANKTLTTKVLASGELTINVAGAVTP